MSKSKKKGRVFVETFQGEGVKTWKKRALDIQLERSVNLKNSSSQRTRLYKDRQGEKPTAIRTQLVLRRLQEEIEKRPRKNERERTKEKKRTDVLRKKSRRQKRKNENNSANGSQRSGKGPVA